MYEKYFFGTKGFSAPEQRMGIVDERTDIYALGKLIEYLHKYQVERAKADGLLKGILRRCCEELPDRRFKTAEEVKTELEKLLKDVARERLEGGKFVENSKKTITVGVVGAFRGAGTTHTAIMLAGYFRKKTKGKVAIAEASGRMDIGSMKAYGAEFEEGFKIKGISFFEVGTERDIVKLYNNDFSYLVLDMGTIEEGIQEEFLRCDYKVVVTGNALWRDRYNEVLYKALKAHGNSRWIVLNNLETALKRRDLYSKEIKQAAIGFCEDIFNISEKTQKHLKALFN